MAFFTQLLVGIALQIIGYLLMPKPPAPKPPTLEDFKDPTAEAGRPIPVVFGSVTLSSPNNMGFWDKSISSREAKSSKK
jgi:hypothetical protein